MLKRISVCFLLILLTFTAIFTFSACKKDGDKDANGSGDDGNAKIFIVTKDNYEKAVDKDYRGEIEDVNESMFSEVEYITELDTYYAVVRIPSKTLEKARFTFGGDIKIFNSVNLGGPKVFSAKYDRNENSFYIQKNAETEKYDFYATVSFTVSQDYSGKPADIKFEYSADSETEEYESCVKTEKEIRIKRKADTVSSIGFLTESDYQSGDYEDKIQERIEVAADEKCYAVIDYAFSDEVEINETDIAELGIYISPSVGVEYDLGVEALPTTEYLIQDGTLSASFRIHDGIGDGKKFRFIVSFSAKDTESFTVVSTIYGKGIFFVGGYRATGTIRVNADLVRESKLEYTPSDDESYYILTGLGNERGDTVNVPATHKGLPVKEIDSFVFMDANHIKKVILSEGLEKIGASAFKNCAALESVIIPSSVTDIGSEAFAGGSAEICCVAAEKPEGWDDTWVETDRHVTWSCASLYTLNEDGKSYSFTLNGLGLTDVKILKKYGYLPVTAIADNAFASSAVKTVIIPEEIEIIGEKAFYGCTALTEISLPSSVRTVEKSAFEGCTSLKSVVFDEECEISEIGESAFSGCTSLTEISVPDSVETVGNKAFKGCSSLETVSLGEKLRYLAAHTFDCCVLLSEIILPDTLEIIYEYAFFGCTSLTEISIPDKVGVIDSYAFNGCSLLEAVSFGDDSGLVRIGEKAFESCVSLTDFTFVSDLLSIDSYAFSGCVSLSSVKIPMNVETVGASAFYLCTGLKEVTVEYGVEHIGNSVFSGCSGITRLVLPNSIRDIGECAFLNCTGLTEVTLSENLVKLSYGVFSGCEKLKNIVIPAFVVNIEEEAFMNCSSLESVSFTKNSLIRTGVVKIGVKAFYNCASLTEITFPDTLEKIEENAFEGCTNLSSITLGTDMEIIRGFAFYNCTALTSIKYLGSETQWTAITKGNAWDEYDVSGVRQKLNYTVIYNYTE